MTKAKTSFTANQMELASKLTPLQRKFVIELIKPNTTQRQAIKAAGSKAKTDMALDNVASQTFSKVQVKAFYDSLMEEVTVNAVYTKEKAIERLASTAQVTITDVCDFRNVKVGEDENGNDVFQTVWTIKNSEDIPNYIAAAIKSVTVTQNGPKIELHDSHGSIKQLADMLAWNAPKKTELTGKDGQALQLSANVESPEIASALAGLMEKL